MDAESFFFEVNQIDDKILSRIAQFSFRDAPRAMSDDLLYVRFPFFSFRHTIEIGEMVINKCIREDINFAFRSFYNSEYPIEKIRLIDEYAGDDNRSMADNNTVCFNYRKIANTDLLSNHALALAVDINPLYNPYVAGEVVFPLQGKPYVDRNKRGEYKIDHADLAYDIFVKQLGWEWGGDWIDKFGYADYQHFSKIHKEYDQ